MKWFIRGLLVVAICVFVANYFEWSPKAKSEAAENLAVRQACLKLRDQAVIFHQSTGRYPRDLSEVAGRFIKVVGDTSGFEYVPEVNLISHGFYRVTYVLDTLNSRFDVNIIDPDLDTYTVCTWPPRPVIGG